MVSGTNAPVKITLDGLSKADSSAIELVPGPLALETDGSNFAKEVTVPAGSPLAKFSVYSSDEAADFDMVVFNPAGQALLAQTASASESISVPNPAAGRLHDLREPLCESERAAHQGFGGRGRAGGQRGKCHRDPQSAAAR